MGADWPLGYADLEPYYAEVEHVLGVSGPSPFPWGSPRPAYPLPPLPLNGAAQLMQRGCFSLGIRTAPAANAALFAARHQPGYGWRPACTNRGFCQAGCSTGAKASMDVTFIPLAVAAGAEVRPECFVTQLVLDRRGRVAAVVYVRDGREERGLPKPRVHFSAGENERRLSRHAERVLRAIWHAAEAGDVWAFPRSAHLIGTCRMGAGGTSAVVDRDGRSFDVPDLYVSDNSTFPSALSANPALTIMALALRTADRFLARAPVPTVRGAGHAH